MTAPVANRIPQHPIAEIFVNRWSPRSFTGEDISDETLFTFFEAARWAPSLYNSQPWRFLYAKRGSAWFDRFLRLLSARNRIWANNAAVLIVLISKTTFTPDGQTQTTPMRNHSEAGAAWSNFAHRATLSGWHAHGIGDFNAERACAELNIPSDFHIDAAIAVGRRGDWSILPEMFHPGENPNGRKAVAEVFLEGGFTGPS